MTNLEKPKKVIKGDLKENLVGIILWLLIGGMFVLGSFTMPSQVPLDDCLLAFFVGTFLMLFFPLWVYFRRFEIYEDRIVSRDVFLLSKKTIFLDDLKYAKWDCSIDAIKPPFRMLFCSKSDPKKNFWINAKCYSLGDLAYLNERFGTKEKNQEKKEASKKTRKPWDIVLVATIVGALKQGFMGAIIGALIGLVIFYVFEKIIVQIIFDKMFKKVAKSAVKNKK